MSTKKITPRGALDLARTYLEADRGRKVYEIAMNDLLIAYDQLNEVVAIVWIRRDENIKLGADRLTGLKYIISSWLNTEVGAAIAKRHKGRLRVRVDMITVRQDKRTGLSQIEHLERVG